jgi:hypothetical protein
VHEGVAHGTGACVCARKRDVALGALGGTATSRWHRHGTVQSGSEGAALRGMGHGRLGELDGEVTGRAAVGGVLALPGCPRRHGDGQGGVRCEGTVSAGWGRLEGASRTASRHWGSMAVVWVTARGRGRHRQGFALGLPLSLDSNRKRQGEEG